MDEIQLKLVEGTVIKLEPGDHLLVKVPKTWSRERADQLHDVVRKWAGPGIRILLGTDDVQMEVVKSDG